MKRELLDGEMNESWGSFFVGEKVFKRIRNNELREVSSAIVVKMFPPKGTPNDVQWK